MCLYVDKDSVKQIAQEDIPCVKLLLKERGEVDRWVSPYKGYVYVLGELVEAEIGEPEPVDVDQYFATGEQARAYEKSHRKIESGLHSFTEQSGLVVSERNQAMIARWNIETVDYYYFKAIIPKGAEYCEGMFTGNRSYVSNKLIVLEQL